MRVAGIEEAGQLGIAIASRHDRIVSHQHIPVPERLLSGQESTECIGLVREFCCEDPKCHVLVRQVWAFRQIAKPKGNRRRSIANSFPTMPVMDCRPPIESGCLTQAGNIARGFE
jgi:hypothetical protein